MPDDHSASRRVEILREEAPHLLGEQREQPIDIAIEAIEFKLEWLADYGQREYGSDAANVTARYQQALDALRAQAPANEETSISADELDRIRGALDDLATLAADPRRDVSTLGIDLLDIHTRIAGTLLLDDEHDDNEPRTILVHINVELPADAPATADDIADEIRAAIEIATDDSSATENMPGLTSGAWSIPLAEEV